MMIRFLQIRMIFRPIALIASIVVFIRRMVSVKVYKESAVVKCSWMFFQGNHNVYLGQVSFGNSRSRDFVRDEE